MNYKPRRTGVGLDNVFEFRAGVFESGWWMLDDGLVLDIVEFGSFDL